MYPTEVFDPKSLNRIDSYQKKLCEVSHGVTILSPCNPVDRSSWLVMSLLTCAPPERQSIPISRWAEMGQMQGLGASAIGMNRSQEKMTCVVLNRRYSRRSDAPEARWYRIKFLQAGHGAAIATLDEGLKPISIVASTELTERDMSDRWLDIARLPVSGCRINCGLVYFPLNKVELGMNNS